MRSENHPLLAQSPSPSLDRGFGPFFASHFHACVVSAGGHGVYSENKQRRYPLEPASLCGPQASRPLLVSHFRPAWWAADHGIYFENNAPRRTTISVVRGRA